jgi:plasmid stabilization system protein ParE
VSYRVVLLPRAEQQLYEAALWWADNRSLDQSLRWLAGFEATIQSLADSPEKHSLARENQIYNFPNPIRQLLYGVGKRPTHRAVYEIRGDHVYVHAIRHLSQRELTPDDI